MSCYLFEVIAAPHVIIADQGSELGVEQPGDQYKMLIRG